MGVRWSERDVGGDRYSVAHVGGLVRLHAREEIWTIYDMGGSSLEIGHADSHEEAKDDATHAARGILIAAVASLVGDAAQDDRIN